METPATPPTAAPKRKRSASRALAKKAKGHEGSFEIERNEKGHFLPGNNGGPGRPLGMKNKLSEDFIEDFHNAWREHGVAALNHMAKKEPSAFVRCATQLMPRDVLLEARGAGLIVVKLSDEDLAL
jgi:hypothetical protein